MGRKRSASLSPIDRAWADEFRRIIPGDVDSPCMCGCGETFLQAMETGEKFLAHMERAKANWIQRLREAKTRE